MKKIRINPATTNMKMDKVWAALNSYGIYTEEQLEEAVKKMKPINISCMAGKINWPDGKAPDGFGQKSKHPVNLYEHG